MIELSFDLSERAAFYAMLQTICNSLDSLTLLNLVGIKEYSSKNGTSMMDENPGLKWEYFCNVFNRMGKG